MNNYFFDLAFEDFLRFSEESLDNCYKITIHRNKPFFKLIFALSMFSISKYGKGIDIKDASIGPILATLAHIYSDADKSMSFCTTMLLFSIAYSFFTNWILEIIDN